MQFTITPVPVLSDNYVWIIHDLRADLRAIVDPGVSEPVLQALKGAPVDLILLTHHHQDHIGGAEALRAATGGRLVGPDSEAHRLPMLDISVTEGDVLGFGGGRFEVIATPGHVLGHVSYFLPEAAALFTGDTLFSLGCGRLFEGTPGMMFESLQKFSSLPDETRVYCGHEYTLSNIAFAQSLPTADATLDAFAKRIQLLRTAGKPSLPTSLGTERALNPFLKAKNAAQFGRLRAAKDQS